MPLTKSKGNMYPWVTHTHSHLAGRCPHECSYCYVQAMEKKYEWGKYKGPVRMIPGELDVDYGTGKTIFIEHMNDLFAKGVPSEYQRAILDHCRKYPDNKYVFQTKRPGEAETWGGWPDRYMIGTTIESNREYPEISKADEPYYRMSGLRCFMWRKIETFVTIEPILDFDVEDFLYLLTEKERPNFINIGADSKGTGLPEPSKEKVLALIKGIQEADIEIRQKTNLARLLK